MLNNRRQEAAHLLRRAGFGAKSLDELNQFAALTHEQAVARLFDFVPQETALARDPATSLNASQPDSTQWGGYDLQQAWLNVMLQTNYPLQEKIALFWHGHLTSSINKVGDGLLMLDQVQYYRRYGLGSFEKMIRDISRDPAMLMYLDSVENSNENPNENFARELMELFTLGTGNYTEHDIRESARAFTGWRMEYSEDPGAVHPQVVFDTELHDFTDKTFLGETGNFDGEAIITIILKRRQVGYHIARKLWEFFVYPDPAAEVINPLGDLFFDSGFNIRKLVEAIFLHPEFLSPRAYRALVKSPVEVVVGTLRTLGASTMYGDPLFQMGQSLFVPPNVKGWPGGRRWINSATFLARVNYFGELLSPDESEPLRVPVINGFRNQPPINGFNVLAELMLDSQAGGLNNIKSFLDLPYTADSSDSQGLSLEADAKLRGAVHLMTSTPDYQLN